MDQLAEQLVEQGANNTTVIGSTPWQLVEQGANNTKVIGSTPWEHTDEELMNLWGTVSRYCKRLINEQT